METLLELTIRLHLSLLLKMMCFMSEHYGAAKLWAGVVWGWKAYAVSRFGAGHPADDLLWLYIPKTLQVTNVILSYPSVSLAEIASCAIIIYYLRLVVTSH